ncbi:unnamed protein product, partial [Symbiodinium necroappetens]
MQPLNGEPSHAAEFYSFFEARGGQAHNLRYEIQLPASLRNSSIQLVCVVGTSVGADDLLLNAVIYVTLRATPGTVVGMSLHRCVRSHACKHQLSEYGNPALPCPRAVKAVLLPSLPG